MARIKSLADNKLVAYGRQAKAIALAAEEEGIKVTEQEAQAIVDTIFKMYPGLVKFFEECRARAVTRDPRGPPAPRWLCGPFGRFRRFRDTDDRKIKGEYERQSQNFPRFGEVKRGELKESLLLTKQQIRRTIRCCWSVTLSQARVERLLKVQRLATESTLAV